VRVQSLIGSRGVADSVSRRVRQLRHLCMFISSSIKICSFLDDLPSELRWNAVLDQVSQDNGDDVDGDDGGESEKSRTALQALYHLMTSAKDDVERRIRGVMTRTVDALSVCIRRRTTAVTSPCVVPTPWHDVSRRCRIGTHFLLTLETVVFLFHLLSTTSKPLSSLSTRLAHAACLGFFYKKKRAI